MGTLLQIPSDKERSSACFMGFFWNTSVSQKPVQLLQTHFFGEIVLEILCPCTTPWKTNILDHIRGNWKTNLVGATKTSLSGQKQTQYCGTHMPNKHIHHIYLHTHTRYQPVTRGNSTRSRSALARSLRSSWSSSSKPSRSCEVGGAAARSSVTVLTS